MKATLGRFARRGMMEAVLFVVCLYLSLRAPNFLTKDNLLNILRSISMQGLIAFGMTLVIILREIDLSVGMMATFSGCMVASLTQAGVPLPIGILCALATGGVLGGFTGVMRHRFQVPSFITTLALFTGLRGLALLLTGGFPITPFPQSYSFLAGGNVAGVPFPVCVLIGGFLAMHVLLTYTAFGRAVYAAGGNPEAARLCGIRVARIRTLSLALTGALAAWSGVMLSARIMAGSPTATEGWEMDVIAAVIIGGTSFAGGIGTIWGTLIGVLFIGVVVNGMTLLNVPAYTQYVVRGLLIFAAVLLNRAQNRTDRET